MLANEFIRLPYQFMSQVPPWVPRWGPKHKDFVRNAYRRTIVIMGPVQEMPVFDSRVQVDPKVKDHWGIPGGAALRRQAPAHPRNRAIHGRQGRGVAEGSRRRPDLATHSRRPA